MKGSDDYLSDERKIQNKRKNKNSNIWIFYVFLITFVLSISFGSISNLLAYNLNVVVACIILFLIILVGVIFDMIGMSVVICDEATFHAKASKKQKGATMKKNLNTKTLKICR